MLLLLQSMKNPGFICSHNMGQNSVLIKGCILISGLHADKQSLFSSNLGNMFKPRTHNMIPETDWQGWVGMLVASLLPGQMAQLLGEEDASWRGVTALQRAQSSTEQKCWQLLMHLPERKETVLPRKLCIRVCVHFLLSMVFLTRLIKIKGRKTHQKAHIQAQPVNVCFNLLAWKGCTIPKTHTHYQGSCFKMSPLTGNDTAAQTKPMDTLF